MQLPLPVRLPDDASFANFHAHARAALALGALREALARPGSRVFLHGAPGSGRTHLLQACCHALEARGEAFVYLPLAALAAYPPAEVLAGLETSALVCLDDLDAVAGAPGWEEQLFHLCNRLAGTRLLVAARQPPAALGIALADLRSRLQAMLVLAVGEPADEDKRAALMLRASNRGLVLEPEVARYILSRAPRGMGELIGVLERLDQRSLAAGRRLSVPFVRDAMQW